MRSTQPPEGAPIPDLPPGSPPAGTPIPSHYRWCVACGGDHPCGLHLQLVTGDGPSVRGRFKVSTFHQGSPGLAHGGVLATAMDEVLGYLNWVMGTPSVTARLEVDYRRPVPVGSELWLESRIVGVRGRKVFGEALGRLDNEQGPVAVEARALFMQVPIEHFLTQGNAELVQQAVADRAAGGPSWLADGQAIEVNP